MTGTKSARSVSRNPFFVRGGFQTEHAAGYICVPMVPSQSLFRQGRVSNLNAYIEDGKLVISVSQSLFPQGRVSDMQEEQ